MLRLTPTQRDIYLEGKIFGGAVNNIGGYQKYLCALDVPRFIRARQLLLEGNDAYRLRFEEVPSGCVPIVADADTAFPAMIVLDFSANGESAAMALDWIQQQFQTPFDDIAEAVFQDALIKISQDQYWYYAKAHHLVMDGWGFALQMRRLLDLYRQLASGPVEDAGGPSFVAYMREQAGYPESAPYAQSRDYWLAQYEMAARDFLSARTEPVASGGARSRRVSATIDAQLFRSLNELAGRAGANIVTVFYATLYVYFSRAYDCDDVVISSPVHNRRSAAEKAIIGSLVNVNAHRLTSGGTERFDRLVQAFAQVQKKNHRHSRFPIGDLIRTLRDRQPSSTNSLQQISFNYQKLDFELTVESTQVQTHYLSHNQEQVPLTFVVCDYGSSQDVALHLDYRTDCLDESEAAAILQRILGLLSHVACEQDIRIDQLRLVTDAEWRSQFEAWNRTQAPLRENLLLHELFEEQAARTPDSVAVVAGAESLTYRELNQRADLVARRLVELGAGPERLVGVFHDRSCDLIVSILAVLKSGSAYVPLDPAYPAARIEYMLEDAQIGVVLADSRSAGAFSGGADRLLDVAALWQSRRQSTEPPSIWDRTQPRACATDLAYVIYTSGSTGRPKGVMIEHRNACAFIQWVLQAYSADDLAAVLAATSICFDLSIFEIFAPLAAGGKVVLADNVLALRDGNFDDISLINTVPSAIKPLLEASAIPRSVRCVNLAGELLRQDLVDALYELPGLRVHDLYGPTEDTTYSTWCLREKHGRQTIGRPISNTQVYVLDTYGQPLPVGRIGELYIGGAGLARGYLNQAELTSEKFVFNPHTQSRLYRTGDLVKFGREGELRYVGRKDSQIKLRGHRIELGEIEASAMRHPAVNQCAAVIQEDTLAGEGRSIVAYLAVGANGVADPAAQRQLTESVADMLSLSLPGYAMPSLFVCLSELPLSSNGKVDRKALPVAGPASRRVDGFLAPRTVFEQRLRTLWSSLVRRDDIGVRDNFFAVGGDSLLLMRLATAIESEFSARIDLSELFANATVELQARLLERRQEWSRMIAAVSAMDDTPCTSHITL